MSTKLTRASDIVWDELEGRALLIDPATGARWTLNAPALALWKLCDGSRTLRALTATMARTTGRCLADCRSEVKRFVNVLNASGFLKSTDGSMTMPAACFERESFLQLHFQGRNLSGARRRPSPRGNSGPG
jgi:hypothetical protein